MDCDQPGAPIAPIAHSISQNCNPTIQEAVRTAPPTVINSLPCVQRTVRLLVQLNDVEVQVCADSIPELREMLREARPALRHLVTEDTQFSLLDTGVFVAIQDKELWMLPKRTRLVARNVKCLLC